MGIFLHGKPVRLKMSALSDCLQRLRKSIQNFIRRDFSRHARKGWRVFVADSLSPDEAL
jgi:hypothetical protein